MNSKLPICLVLVLSGGFAGCSQDYQSNNDAARVENNHEILRLAKLIGPTNPPITDQMLESGEFDGSLFGLKRGRSINGVGP